ncbi:hypothetical protein ACFC8N_05230 [Streptomyces sp. NPDC055966]|uniref:hypothetical protein n=1 Tax=Streptomyces sp. NPDC055966 TaxID=3345669 RepID=UPI0035E2A608
MTTYGYGGRGRISLGDGTPPDLETLMAVAERLTAALQAEYPGIAEYGVIIQRQFEQSMEDGLPPNLGRIRSSLNEIAIRAGAGTGSLTFTQRLLDDLGL